MNIAGVDEAGKGPVVGSMFVAGVMIEEDSLKRLESMGLRDSKMLSPQRRTLFALRIQKVCDYYVHEISAKQIDELRSIMTINDILFKAHARVLRELKPDCAYIDASDVNPLRFAEKVIAESGIKKIIAEHKADVNRPIVSAASILAKVLRDTQMKELENKIGLKIGSGYSSDQTTIKFLITWIHKNGRLPDFTRHSWKTAQNIIKQHSDSCA